MVFQVPTKIETERTLLRQPYGNDWVALHKYYSDAKATRYTVGKPLSEGESWRTVASMIGHWHIHGYGPYVIEEKQSQTVIGVTGFWYPGDWPEPEIKWGLVRDYWGKGYASEAARSVLFAADKSIPEISLISLIHSENLPSIKLALALEAVFEKEITFRASQFHIYRHMAKK
ncbi:MAG: GNAT family N-acetyltransferase [Pseudomonadales bacterium]